MFIGIHDKVAISAPIKNGLVGTFTLEGETFGNGDFGTFVVGPGCNDNDATWSDSGHSVRNSGKSIEAKGQCQRLAGNAGPGHEVAIGR